jgi:hypothetical protein
MQHSEWEIGRSTMKFGMMVTLFFASVMALLCLLKEGRGKALGAFFFFSIVGLPVVLLLGIQAARAFRSDRPTFTVCDGKLTVRIGAEIFDVPLQDCTWSEGKASQTNVLTFGQNNHYGSFLRGPAIVFQIPTTYERSDCQITVGFKAETYQIWKSFLTLSRVPRLQVHSKRQMKMHERIYQWWLSPA